jgi:NADH-quinone oxidoreductase subunit J
VIALLAASGAHKFHGAVGSNIAFGIVAVMMILAAIRVVTTKNVVHAALYLTVVLAGVGVDYLLLQAEFVAITQFLVYIGAVIVLILFGVMLTRAPLGISDDLDDKRAKPIGVLVGLVLLAVLSFAVIKTWTDTKIPFRLAVGDNTRQISDSIFSTYLIPFEAASVLLLAALIGAIVLARKD